MEHIIDDIRDLVLEQFALMSEEIGYDIDVATEYFSGVRITSAFRKQIASVRALISDGIINPNFTLNINRGDSFDAVPREVKVVFFAFAGNPPHWGHLLTALDAMIQVKADKVVFVSNGSDARKPDLADVRTRYDLIGDVVKIFEPLFEFGNLAEVPLFDASVPLIGEHSLFRFLKMNRETKMTVYYLAGSDHLHRILPGTENTFDTIGYLEDNVQTRRFNFNPHFHTVIALINARDTREYEKKIRAVKNPSVTITRLQPTLSFSSTELRRALSGEGYPEALFFLPYVNYVKIMEKQWYVTPEHA